MPSPERGDRHHEAGSGAEKTVTRQQWALRPSVVSRGCTICRGQFWMPTLALLAWVMMLHPAHAQRTTIRVGYFPNATHVHALVAQNLLRHGHDWFAERLGPQVTVEWKSYNAGPSAMRAIFARSIDLSYAGPNSVINAYAQSHGEELRIVAGAVNGGSALVVQPNSKLGKPSDFRGKRIAVPEFENTQDISARSWLAAGDVRVTQPGAEVQLVPTPNSEQLA